MADIEAIRGRLVAITPGKWIAEGNVIRHANGLFHWRLREGDTGEIAHAAFIAHAPEDIAALLAQVDAQQEAARLREIDCALLETRVAALEDALHAVRVAFADVAFTDRCGDFVCIICGGSARSLVALEDRAAHAESCPYARALGED